MAMKITLAVIILTVNHKITLTGISFALRGAILYIKGMISPAQIRAARALIGWKQTELASAAGLSEMSVKNIERGSTDPRVSTLEAIRTALEAAGVEFINDERGDGVVRLRDKS